MSDDWRVWMAEADRQARQDWLRDQVKLDIAKKLLNKGFSVEEVSDVCDFRVDIFKKVMEWDFDAPTELLEKLSIDRP